MYFHCDRMLIEHPSLLIAALASHGITCELSDCQKLIYISVGGHEAYIHLRRKRFCANLRVTDRRGLPLSTTTEESLASHRRLLARIRAKEEFCENLDNSSIIRLIEQGEYANSIHSSLKPLGWAKIESPLVVELEYVEQACELTPAIVEMITSIRNHEAIVAVAIEQADFVKADKHATERDARVNELYDLCTASG